MTILTKIVQRLCFVVTIIVLVNPQAMADGGGTSTNLTDPYKAKRLGGSRDGTLSPGVVIMEMRKIIRSRGRGAIANMFAHPEFAKSEGETRELYCSNLRGAAESLSQVIELAFPGGVFSEEGAKRTPYFGRGDNNYKKVNFEAFIDAVNEHCPLEEGPAMVELFDDTVSA